MVALVAAGCGLLGSVLGSGVTAWAAKAGADKSAETVLGQTHDQAANEHAHWLRQQRLSACEGFLDAWDECTRTRKELARRTEGSQPGASRADLSRSASRMLERAIRIAILGPGEVSQAAESISEAMLKNIEREDEFGKYMESAVSRMREQQSQIHNLTPNLHWGPLREAFGHAHDVEELQQRYSLEELDRIVTDAEGSMEETQEWLRRMTTFGELGEEVNNEGARFLEEFQRNIQVAEENREVFVRTVRSSIASPPQRDV